MQLSDFLDQLRRVTHPGEYVGVSGETFLLLFPSGLQNEGGITTARSVGQAFGFEFKISPDDGEFRFVKL